MSKTLRKPHPYLMLMMILTLSVASGFIFDDEDISKVSSPLLQPPNMEDLPKGLFPWGDLNGDGYDDIVIASPSANGGKGSAFIHFGSSSGMTTEIGSLMGPIGLGSHIRISDIDSDGYDDLILLDNSWRPFIIWGTPEMPREYSLEGTDVFMDMALKEMRLMDADNDGRIDVVYLDEIGRIKVILGPLEPVSPAYVLGDLTGLTRLYIADLDGDGSLEIVVLNNRSEMSILHPGDGSVLSRTLNMSMYGPASFGDVNGDGSDDIIYLDLKGNDHGAIRAISGSELMNTINQSTGTMIGTPEYPLNTGTVLGSSDLDGDGFSDIIVGSPDHHGGLGAVRFFFGGEDFLVSSRSIVQSDSSLIGNESFSPIGNIIIAGADMDADLLPELIIGDDLSLMKVDLPSNNLPGEFISGRMFLSNENEGERYAQIWDRLGIRIRSVDSSDTTLDLLGVELSSSRGTSRIVLRETAHDSGEFIGHILLSTHSMDGRSIACKVGDRIMASSDNGWSDDIFIAGTLGIDDPPILIGELPKISAMEDEYFNLVLDIIDPDGDELMVMPIGIPSWLSLNGTELSGTPGNDDVGSGSFTINASSTSHYLRLQIDYEIFNRSPSLLPISVPNQAWEGVEYKAVFQLREDGERGSLQLVLEDGPYAEIWIKAEMDGIVVGTPDNIHVGSWSFTLVFQDGNDGWASHSWSIQVLNADPIIDDVSPIRWMEHSQLVLNINCTGEADSLTEYSIQGESHGATINNITGLMWIVPVIGTEKNITVRVRVDDGHGGNSFIDISIEIINQAPFLLNPLPDRITSWRMLEIDLSTNEDDLYDVFVEFVPGSDFIFKDPSMGHGRIYRAFPWNMDAGEHITILSLRDEWGGERTYDWNFEVVSDPQMKDPEIILSSVRYVSRDSIEIGFTIHNGSGQVNDVRIRSIGSDNEWLDVVMRNGGWESGSLKVGSPPNQGALNISLEASFFTTGVSTRSLETNAYFDPGPRPSEKDRSISVMITLAVVLLIVILGASLLFVERTSLAIQAAFIKGGRVLEDDMLPAIQDRPGITWRQLQNAIPLGRKDAISTLESLEMGGFVYEITDGPRIRFYPMMGSFKDRPLSLNRYQGLIGRALLGSSRGMDEEDLSRETGIDTERVRRECQMMQLKGAISIKRRRTLDVYSLSIHQREMLKRWSRS